MELLAQHFDAAFSAPYGIQNLRELILSLAMQGKLVTQDRNDLQASELLKDIEVEKKRLVSEGKIKAPKPLQKAEVDKVPYSLPENWVWARLGDVCSYIQRGKGPVYADLSSHRVLSQKCVRWYGLDLEPARFIETESLLKYEPIRLLKGGDLLWNSTGTGTIGRACLVPAELETSELVADSHVTVVRALLLNPVFLWRWIQSPTVQRGIEGAASGTTNQIELNTSTVINYLIPVPPLQEQHRIVAKIDQLMARCDVLENLRNAREELLFATHAAALSQLLDIAGSVASSDARTFITKHFSELYAVKQNVAGLRKAILRLAVMGRLVPQDQNDLPASALLKDIEAEKKQLIKDGTIRGTRGRGDAKALRSDEMPNLLPKCWEWVRLSSVFVTSSGNTFDASLEKETGAFAYVKVGDMNLPGNELIITTSSRFIDPDEKMSRHLIPAGSIIFPKRGGAIATNKKRIVCNPIFVDLNTMAITPIQGVIIDYAYLWLLTIDLSTLNTGTSVPQINHQDIDPLPFPLPPLPEQHRIVAKVNKLMVLCDILEERITAATLMQTELLNAVMAKV